MKKGFMIMILMVVFFAGSIPAFAQSVEQDFMKFFGAYGYLTRTLEMSEIAAESCEEQRPDPVWCRSDGFKSQLVESRKARVSLDLMLQDLENLVAKAEGNFKLWAESLKGKLEKIKARFDKVIPRLEKTGNDLEAAEQQKEI